MADCVITNLSLNDTGAKIEGDPEVEAEAETDGSEVVAGKHNYGW